MIANLTDFWLSELLINFKLCCRNVGSMAKYNYRSLADLKPYKSVNIFGVVKFFTKPTKCKTSEYIMQVSIVDQSLYKDRSKLKCNLFSKDVKNLPAILEIGDIIRIQNLQINYFKDEFQGRGNRYTTFVVFSGKVGNSLGPRYKSSMVDITASDEKKVLELRQWIEGQPMILTEQLFCTFKDMVISNYYSCNCQIVSTCVIEPQICLLLRVWDGTQPKSHFKNVHLLIELQEVVTNKLLYERAQGFLVDICLYDDHCIKGLSLKPGQFLQLHNLHTAKSLSIDKDTGQDLIELILHRGKDFNRGFNILDEESQTVKDLISLFDEVAPTSLQQITTRPEPTRKTKSVNLSIDESKSSSEDELEIEIPPIRNCLKKQNDVKNILTAIVGQCNIPKTSLKEITQETSKYRCVVQVLDYFPKAESAIAFLRLYCPTCHYSSRIPDEIDDTLGILASMCEKADTPPMSDSIRDSKSVCIFNCPQCTPEESFPLDYIYMMKFIVADESCVVEILMWREAAITFFQNIQPISLLSDPVEFKFIQDSLTKICPPKASKVEQPWIECCLMSYKPTIHSGLKLQIFDTVLM